MGRVATVPSTAPPDGISETGFITWLDELQLEWARAARRLSPRLAVELLDWLGPRVGLVGHDSLVRRLTMPSDQAWRLLTNNLPAPEQRGLDADGRSDVVRALLTTRAIVGDPQ